MYSDGIDMCKDHKQLRTNRALVCNKLGRYPEAIEDCTKVLDICELFEANSGPGVKDARLKSLSRRATAYKASEHYAVSPWLHSHCAQGMGQLVEAVADAELALSLDPNNKEIETQLKGLRTDLRDANTAKMLQQQLQQPPQEAVAAAAPNQNSSQPAPPAETSARAAGHKPVPSPSEATSASVSENLEPERSKLSAAPAAAAAAPAASASPAAPVDQRLVSANSLLQVMRLPSLSCRCV